MRLAALLLPLASVLAAAPPDFFPKADLMNIGVYYYPETWPREQWPRDMANIRKLGLEFVHMGEFAWSFMEPQEGRAAHRLFCRVAGPFPAGHDDRPATIGHQAAVKLAQRVADER